MAYRTGMLGVAAVVSLAAACNALTGADEVSFSDDDGDGGTSSGVASGGNGSGGGTNVPMAPADGVSITAVEIYQGVRRPLMEAGTPSTSGLPVVTGRDALMRVHYTAEAAAVGSQVTARVTLGAERVDATGLLAQSSTVESLGSTLNVPIPGELVAPVSYRVEILAPIAQTSGENAAAVYPPAGQEQLLPAQNAGAQLKLVLVPVRYGADGSDRLPDTSPEQLELYRDVFFQLYPIPAVEIAVTEPMQWNQTVSPFGQGWTSLLDAMISFRQQSNAAPEEYYYGIFAGASSFGEWCQGGCVTGLSLLDEGNDPFARVGIGVGFSGEQSAHTASHEVGHQHGRGHAPCETFDGIDPAFPHPDGSIGEWGYDLLANLLVQPSTPDFMSYCDPPWVSDHNFQKLFDRLRLVNNAAADVAMSPRTFERIVIDESGTAHWASSLTLTRMPTGEPTRVDVDGHPTQGWFYPYSHLPGGMLLLENAPPAGSRVSFVAAGGRHTLSR